MNIRFSKCSQTLDPNVSWRNSFPNDNITFSGTQRVRRGLTASLQHITAVQKASFWSMTSPNRKPLTTCPNGWKWSTRYSKWQIIDTLLWSGLFFIYATCVSVQYASEDAELLLVGNKLDCESDRIISRQQAERVRIRKLFIHPLVI